jgi:2-C-methyl-D-erythritol 4-phosphate cytidylyltransferase
MSTSAIIVAAGTSERLSGNTPKQLLPVAGMPMLLWSAHALMQVCDALVVVAPPGRENDLKGAVAGVEKVHAVVAGGATRQESVWNGLQALPEGATRVMIHDAARPCVSRALLDRIIESLDEHDAVVPAVPAVDTLIRESESQVDAILDRACISGVQTPQAFAVALIVDAHRKSRKNGRQSSDDGSLVLALGQPVATVRGERTNIKVTYPEDVTMAEAILKERGE